MAASARNLSSCSGVSGGGLSRSNSKRTMPLSAPVLSALVRLGATLRDDADDFSALFIVPSRVYHDDYVEVLDLPGHPLCETVLECGGHMTFGVFIHRADSIYDDSPAERYQFPKQYLKPATKCVGDWIVYYEPTKLRNSKGYFAVAKVANIVPDPTKSDMYLALIEPGTYLDFANPVPLSDQQGYIETGIVNEAGRPSGRAQLAIRGLSSHDFYRITSRGLEENDVLLPRVGAPQEPIGGFDEVGQTPFVYEEERERVSTLVSRAVRDRVFRRVVLRAYGERCAVTGLRLINGGGRAEVDAAHIRPVEQKGPDIVNNGIALSGTAHWMFDRGLIGIVDDLTIEVSRHVNDVESVSALINKTGRLIGPIEPRNRPHPAFLSWHRENVFKQ